MSIASVESITIFVLLLVNGVLAMSEMAVVSSRKARLQMRSDHGDRGAELLSSWPTSRHNSYRPQLLVQLQEAQRANALRDEQGLLHAAGQSANSSRRP